MKMTSPMVAIVVLAAAGCAHAVSVNGTVTNKTTSKPSAGDTVVLVDLSAGMGEVARATTDANGHYRLQTAEAGTFLIRVDHQGGSYFIAAPQGNSPGDITVYDVAPKVEGVGIDADMMLIEAGAGSLRVKERYLVRNISSPPRTQFSENTFEVVLPEGALLDEAAATRPGGLGTRTHLVPLAQKGHYTFNVPIQPDQGEKETLFEVQYHFACNGRHQLALNPQMPAESVVVYTAKGIEFAAKDSSRFRLTQEDPRVDTHVARDVQPGSELAFTVSGEGQMPPDATSAAMRPASIPGEGMAVAGAVSGVPIASPDTLTSSKIWLLTGLAIVLAGSTFLFLRRRSAAFAGRDNPIDATEAEPTRFIDASVANFQPSVAAQARGGGVILDSLKEELFVLEKDKISGRISAEEYERLKGGLEFLLKRALIPTAR
jgi:hypothetical protein